MKKFILQLLFISFATITFSQNVNVKWGDIEKFKSKSISPILIGKQNKKIFVLKSDNNKNIGKYYINVYDEDNLSIDSKIDFNEILPEDIQDNELEKILMLKEKFLILSSSKKNDLIATSIDLDGKLIKDRIFLDHIDGKDKKFNGYTIKVSEDFSKILGMRKSKGKTKKTCSYSFTLFDIDLKKINTIKKELPYLEDNFEILSTSLDNNGDVNMIAKIKIEGSKKKYDAYKAVLMNLDLSKKDAQFNEVNLPFEKRIATSMSFKMNSDNTITLTGLYASNKESKTLEGVFNIELEKGTFNVISSTYSKFLKGLKSRTKLGKEFESGVDYSYTLQNTFESVDGKVLVFESVISYFSDFRNGTYKNTNTNDIIVVKLDNQNNILWNTQIYKYQGISIPYSTWVGFGPLAIEIPMYRMYKRYEDLLSYACLNKGDNLYFIFNDHTKNMNSNNADKIFNSFKKAYCAIVTLNLKTGKWEKKTIFTKKESKKLITPNNSDQISEDKILTFSFEKNTKSGIGYITVD